MKTKSITITPLQTKEVPYNDLPNHYKEAIKICTDCADFDAIGTETNGIVQIETYSAETVRALLNHWGWDDSIKSLTHSDDIERVQTIMDRIKKTGERYPYVSYWAPCREDLCEIELESDGDWYFRNHGDGWHRLVATLEMEYPTMDFIFLSNITSETCCTE